MDSLVFDERCFRCSVDSLVVDERCLRCSEDSLVVNEVFEMFRGLSGS